MTRTQFRIFIFFTGLSLFLISCRQAKKELTASSYKLNPVVIEAKGHSVPLDSMPKWKIVPLENPKIIAAGKPRIIQPNSNKASSAIPHYYTSRHTKQNHIGYK
jgi:hypothetical protein